MKKARIAAVVFGALAFAMAGPANAAFQLSLTDGAGNSVLIQDQDFTPLVGTVADGGAAEGVIVFNGDLGALPGDSVWTVNITTGISKPIIGGPTLAIMDLTSVNVSSSGAGTLTIELSDQGFVTPAGDVAPSMAIGGFTSASVTYDAWVNSSNALFAKQTLISTMGAFGPGAFSDHTMVDVADLGIPYSLTQRIVIAHTDKGQITSFDAAIAVPEPETLGLFGIGLLCLGLLWRLSARREAARA